jgi:hypothetical protein
MTGCMVATRKVLRPSPLAGEGLGEGGRQEEGVYQGL